ncbi:hypothetical protein ACTFIY_000943 [Dictyostelium cf. discoideum]
MDDKNLEIKVELNVDISCQSCVDSISKELREKLENTKLVEHDIPEQRIVLQGTDLTQDILETIKNTGRNATICGLSSTPTTTTTTTSTCHKKQESVSGSAVCSLGLIENWQKGCGGSGGIGSKGVYGVIRLLRASTTKTLFEGRITGLKPGKHSLVVHEFGNLMNGCDDLGEPFISNIENNNNSNNNNNNNNSNNDNDKNINKCKEILNKIIGTSDVKQDGKAEFRVLSDKYDFWDLIGRSIVLHSQDSKYSPIEDVNYYNNNNNNNNKNNIVNSESDKILGERVACGIISRAASVGQNHKKVCPCDGTTAI